MAYLNNNITIDPKIKFGKPVIKGTRVPVDLVIGKLAGGMNMAELMQEYDLTQEQILTVLKYALTLVKEEQLVHANYAHNY